ncbi:hypothetical protein ABPG72_012260 [Tetrahymena utriculariae]
MSMQISSSSRLHFTHDSMENIKQIFCKEFGEDTTEYNMRKSHLDQNPGSIFIDEQFPPDRESLCHNWEDITDQSTLKSWSQITWLRPKDFLKLSPGEQIKLFDTIEPNDIKQGILGDCYFLSSLSSLAEREMLIKRLFETKTYQENGLYAIWLNIEGEWRCIVVDDHIPCKKKQPAFTRSNGNELWVLLLEKAYAKAYGSYYKIEGGNPAVALRDLTGAPYVNFDEKNPDSMFNFLEEHDKAGRGDILTCYTPSTEIREAQLDVGLYSGHAYSILDVRRIKTQDGQEHRILQIRNPWGKGEWKGDWSDNDTKLWNDFTMSQVPTFKREEDGSFWMNIQDFCKYFEGVGACQIQESAKYNSISFKLAQSNQAIIKLQVVKKSKHLTVSLNQKDMRHFNNDESKYKYSFATFILIKKEQDGTIKWIGGEFDVERNITIRSYNLDEGEYYILTEVMWCQNHYRNLIVSCYAEQETNFSLIQEGMEFDKFLCQAIKSYCTENIKFSVGNPNSKIKINKYNGDQIGRIYGSDMGLLFFYFYNFSWNTSLYQKLTFTKLLGYSLPKEYQDKDNIEIAIPPQKEQVLVLKFSATQDYRTEYSFKSSMQMMNKEQCPINPNPSVFLTQIWQNEIKEQQNTAAKDRKLQTTNFSLGYQTVDQTSSVSVLKFEVNLINSLAALIAPFVNDWATNIFRITLLYIFYLLLFSYDSCNFLDMVLIMNCYILFYCQVMTRKRLRRFTLLFLASITLSVVWFILYPQKWNSIDSQYDMIGKAMTYFIPLMHIVFIFLKVYICLFYWKLFVNYEELIDDVYNRFNLDLKKEIISRV